MTHHVIWLIFRYRNLSFLLFLSVSLSFIYYTSSYIKKYNHVIIC